MRFHLKTKSKFLYFRKHGFNEIFILLYKIINFTSKKRKVLRIKHGLRKAVKFVSNEIEQCGFFRGTNVVLIRSTKEAGGRRRGAPIAPV